MPALLVILFVATFVTITSSAEISPSDGTLCHGQEMKWTCTGNATLTWKLLQMTAAYDYMGGFNEETPLDVFQAKLLGSVNTTIRSTARIPAGTMSSHLNGESLECIDSETANVTLFIEESTNISSICVEEQSEMEIVIKLAGASCVSYYVFEINGVQYNNSGCHDDYFIHDASKGYYYVTVSGMNYFNENFTSISSDFNFTEYMFHAYPVVDDCTLYIMIEASIDTRQPPIKSCNVSLTNTNTSNITTRVCSETLKMVSFEVVPGSYEYSVMINNIIGPSNFSGNIDISSSCERMTANFSCDSSLTALPLSPPTPTATSCPTVSPSVTCDYWFILFIVTAVALIITLTFLIITGLILCWKCKQLKGAK